MTEEVKPDETPTPETDDNVPYEKYRKLLAQRKNDTEVLSKLQSKIDSYEKRLKEFEGSKEIDYKALLENRNKELEELNTKIKTYESTIKEKEEREIRYKKLSAFTEQLPAKLKRKEYYSFVDTDKIVIDPDTNDIDNKSLKIYAQQFSEEFKDLLDFKGGPNLPNGKPNGKGTLSYEEWLSLPAKEMKKRMHELTKS